MEILIYMAAIVAALVILAWTLDLDNEEEDKEKDKEADNSWIRGGINE